MSQCKNFHTFPFRAAFKTGQPSYTKIKSSEKPAMESDVNHFEAMLTGCFHHDPSMLLWLDASEMEALSDGKGDHFTKKILFSLLSSSAFYHDKEQEIRRYPEGHLRCRVLCGPLKGLLIECRLRGTFLELTLHLANGVLREAFTFLKKKLQARLSAQFNYQISLEIGNAAG